MFAGGSQIFLQCQQLRVEINLFHINLFFLYPLLRSENLRLSDIIRVYTGFDLTFQKWFVSFPNEINSKTDLECLLHWLRDETNFHSKLSKLALNGIFYFFILRKNYQICILYHKT